MFLSPSIIGIRPFLIPTIPVEISREFRLIDPVTGKLSNPIDPLEGIKKIYGINKLVKPGLTGSELYQLKTF